MENLKKLRGKMGLSQKELAKKVGLNRATINYLENGTLKGLSAPNEKKLCDFLNVTRCELYGIDNLKYFPENRKDMENFINMLTEKMNQKWPL